MPEFILGIDEWPPMQAAHRRFLEGALTTLRADPRLLGVAAGGSFITAALDEYSDLDLVVVAGDEAYGDVLREGTSLAARLGTLLAAFPGDHVGEPRLLICLYGAPLLHVDLKFLKSDDLAQRVEDPVILWDRTDAVRRGIARGKASYPQPDPQWIEDRFWVWVHYTGAKIARGELFEALDSLAVIRRRVLGPLILADARIQPDGVRRVERATPHLVAELRSAIGAHDRDSCRDALEAAVALYASLRERRPCPGLVRRVEAERAAKEFLHEQLRREARPGR